MPRDDRFGIAHVSYQNGSRDAVRYQRAADAGARWNRWAMYWTDVERSPGSYDWSATDQTVAADEQFGFKTNAILLGTPGFYNGALSATDPDQKALKSGSFQISQASTRSP